MLHVDATEGFDEGKLSTKPPCSATESTEVSLEAINSKELCKVTTATSGPDEPETMSSPENIKSPQRLKKAGIDAPTTPLSAMSGEKADPETKDKPNDGSHSERKVKH